MSYSNICFTINNPTAKDEELLHKSEYIKYCVYGIEYGENETKHFQGYIQFKRSYAHSRVKSILPRGHFEKTRNKPFSAIAYCKKGEQSKEEWDQLGIKGPNYGKNAQIVEIGEPKKQGKRNDFLVVKDCIKNGGTIDDIIEIATSYQSVRSAEILLKYKKPESRDYPKDVYWFYGPTGTGKTETALKECREKGKEPWISADTLQWFDGYTGQEYVIIDDFRSHMCKYNFLLRLTDKYPLRVPIKGSYTIWQPQVIYITCNKSPEECYTYQEKVRDDIGQLVRRIKECREFEKNDN